MNLYGKNIAVKMLAPALLAAAMSAPVTLAANDHIEKINQEKVDKDIMRKICNQTYKCVNTGIAINFLEENKAKLISSCGTQVLNAKYKLIIDENIMVSVNGGMGRSFDFIMSSTNANSQGLSATINKIPREFSLQA